MDYILYLCFALVVLIIVNGVLYFIGGLIGLKNSQFRIAIPFGIIFLIVTFIGAFMGWWQLITPSKRILLISDTIIQ